MKNYLKIFAVLMVILLVACGCSTVSKEELDNIEKPVSDVTDGTGLQGTWTGTLTSQGDTSDAVVAFNSDNTCSIYLEVTDDNADDDSKGVALETGTYTDNGTQITLDITSVTGGITVGGFTFGAEGSVDEESATETESDTDTDDEPEVFSYTLDGNSLTMTDAANDITYNLTRDVTAGTEQK